MWFPAVLESRVTILRIRAYVLGVFPIHLLSFFGLMMYLLLVSIVILGLLWTALLCTASYTKGGFRSSNEC